MNGKVKYFLTIITYILAEFGILLLVGRASFTAEIVLAVILVLGIFPVSYCAAMRWWFE